MTCKCFVTSDRFIRATIVLALVSVVSVLPVHASETGLSPNTSIAQPLEPKSAADWLKRGVENAKKNDLDGAIADFNQAIQLKRDYAAAYFNRGTTYANLGRRQNAIADYTQVILLKPNNAYVRYNRGLLLVDAGNKQEAIADFQQAATLFQQQLNVTWQQKALDKVKQLQRP